MIKRILGIICKFAFGVLFFYLFVGLVVVPLGLLWGIQSQGTKFLKHPVQVRSVWFNPFLLRLTINGFEIKDADKKVMAGFDKLSVDASFLSLFKKEYRFESVGIDGLKVNVALLPGGRVNLLDQAPAEASQPKPGAGGPAPAASPDTMAKKPASPLPTTQPLPLVIFDDIAVRKGSVNFVDRTVDPNFSTILHDIDIHVTGLTTRPDCQAKVEFKAGLDEKGVITNEVLIKPFVQPLQLETTFSLNGYALDVLTPYVGKYTGRALKDGNLEFRMSYRIAENKLTASHKVLIQRFEFGQKVESKDALPLPFGLAVAILEDAQGRITISLPVTGDMSKPDFHYWQLMGQVIRNFFTGLVTKPFSFLASALGAESGTEELGYVRFLPGKTDLSDAEKEKLKTLIKGLKNHPKLILETNGGYDVDSDWKAIKKDVLEKDYKELRAQSSRSDSLVYQMLYQRRLGIRDLWALTNKYKLKEGGYDDAKLIEEIRRQLIEEGTPDKAALENLAQARAKVIYDQLISEGLDSQRVKPGRSLPSQASMGFVPSEFSLTVFGEMAPEGNQ